MITNEVEDQIQENGTLCEEDAEETSFIGCRHDCQLSLLYIGRDVCVNYLFALHSIDGDL